MGHFAESLRISECNFERAMRSHDRRLPPDDDNEKRQAIIKNVTAQNIADYPDRIKTDDELAAHVCDEIVGYMTTNINVELVRAVLAADRDTVLDIVMGVFAQALKNTAEFDAIKAVDSMDGEQVAEF